MKLKFMGCVVIGVMALAQSQSPPRRPAFDAFEAATVKPTDSSLSCTAPRGAPTPLP
jgi:hypothetical protein